MPLTHLYFVASAFLLALGSVVAKLLLSQTESVIGPLPFLTLQLLGGVAFLCAAHAARGWRRAPLRRLARPLIAGLFLGVGSVGTIMALALISASEASVIFATQPVVILALAWGFLGERVAPATIVLSLVAFAGVTAIVVGGSGGEGTGRAAGIGFAVMSTVCAAVYVVWMRAMSDTLDVLSALIVVQTVALCVAAAAWGAGAVLVESQTRLGSVFLASSAVGTGMIYYGVAFYVYLVGLRDTDASTAGIYLSLVPVFAIGLAAAVLSERLSAMQWIGAAAVISALTGVSLRAARARSRP